MADELALPVASVTKLLKASLPENVSVSQDVKQKLANAAGVFILYLTSAAQEKCRRTKRSTMNGDDVLQALEEIDISDLTGPLKRYAEEMREEKLRASKRQRSSDAKEEGEDGVAAAAAEANDEHEEDKHDEEEGEGQDEEEEDEEEGNDIETSGKSNSAKISHLEHKHNDVEFASSRNASSILEEALAEARRDPIVQSKGKKRPSLGDEEEEAG